MYAESEHSMAAKIATNKAGSCPTPKCDEQLRPGEFLCRFCFRKVPDGIKRRLYRCQRFAPGWLRARDDAIEWLRNHYNESL
jgi:hypothetical protein